MITDMVVPLTGVTPMRVVRTTGSVLTSTHLARSQ